MTPPGGKSRGNRDFPRLAFDKRTMSTHSTNEYLPKGSVMETSVSDLRKKMGEVMSAIDRHESITLTYRGRRRAVIVPLNEAKKSKVKVADLPAFGMWANRADMTDLVAYVDGIRKPRKI